MSKLKVSNRIVGLIQSLIKRKTGEDFDEKRIKAYLLLGQLKTAINRHPSTMLGKLFWELLLSPLRGGRMKHFLFYLGWKGLMISIENAQRYVLVLPEKPTWAEMVEEIQKYTLIDQGPIVDEYLAEVGELLKLN